jgi:hypothetical protein
MSEFRTQEPSTGQFQAELIKLQSELARERPSERPHSTGASVEPVTRRRAGRGSRLLLALVAIAAIITILFGPGIVGSILDRWDYTRSVHHDRSVAEHGVAPQLDRRALIVVRDADGNPVRALADADAVSEFVRRELERVETARRDTHTRVRAALEARAQPVFANMRSRVPEFADWYYAWPTSYRLTGKAMYSAAANAMKPSVMGLGDAVSHDLARYVEKRYRDIVMRPELSDPLLQWAYLHALETGEGGFQLALNRFDDRFRHFVATETTYLDGEPNFDDVSVVLDWDHQTKKLTVTEVDRGSLEVARGATLATAGVLVGGRAGAAVGARLAQGISRRAAATAARGVAVRLAGPYVARSMGAVAATAVGASGGPMGAVVGGAAGLGLDYAINEGVEYAERDSLEAGVTEALTIQQRQWQQIMLGSLDEAVDVWFDDLAELLAAYESPPTG